MRRYEDRQVDVTNKLMAEYINKRQRDWEAFLRTSEKKLKKKSELGELGRPTKVFYKGKWKIIYWEPCIIVNGKAIPFDKLKGGRRTKE